MSFDYGLLKVVHFEANKEAYVTEIGPDKWTPFLPGCGSDCDSYATYKMQKLFDLGWQLLDMRLATCWTETGEYHCVLLVELNGQSWVLDNRQTYPTRSQDLDYEWHKIQVPGTQDWVYAQAFIDGLNK